MVSGEGNSNGRQSSDHRRRRSGHAATRHRASARATGADGRGGAACRGRRAGGRSAARARLRSASSTSSRGRRKRPRTTSSNALAVAPREQIYTALGGNTPQWQVNEAAERIHNGELKLVLIAGAEGMYSARRARTKGVDLGWSPRGNPTPDVGDTRPGVNEARGEARRDAADGGVPALRECAARSLRTLARRAPGGAGRAVRAVHRGRGGESVRVVPRGEVRARDRDADARQPLHRVPLHQVHELDHRRRPGRRAADDERRRGAPSWHSRGALGVRVGLRRRHGPLVLHRARRTTTRRPRSAPAATARAGHGRRHASTTSRTSISTAAFRRRCRSRATCLASRPATRGR